MSIRESFCPVCGKPSDGGICGRCRAEKTRWMEVSPRAECITCPACGSLKQGSVWQDSPLSREDLVRQLATGAIRLAPEVRNPQFQVAFRERSPNRTLAKVRVRGTLFSIPVEGEADVEVAWRRETCDRCSRISGGYFEGVVQVRATGRDLTGWERETAARIATQVEDLLQEEGARLCFIARAEEREEGLDLIVGENSMGERIAQEITGALGGSYTVHPKLVGERDGRRLFRITYSVRIPRLQKGDVIEADGEYLEVRETGKRHVRAFHLGTGTPVNLPASSPYRMIGNVRDAVPVLVAFREGDMAGVLDPETFVTREVRVPAWVKHRDGSPLMVIPDRLKDRIVIVG